MALFELEQDYGTATEGEWKAPTFKDCAAADIDLAFFEENEHADWHTVDGKKALVILEDQGLKERSAHWEAGAKQNFDTGLYLPTRCCISGWRTMAQSRRSGSTWSLTRERRCSALTASCSARKKRAFTESPWRGRDNEQRDL